MILSPTTTQRKTNKWVTKCHGRVFEKNIESYTRYLLDHQLGMEE